MARTTPVQFTGTPRVTPQIIDTLTQFYLDSLGDSDKAGDPEAVCFYDGQVDALVFALKLLHGMPTS